VRQVLCPVLVGRDEETGHLQAALAAAEAGHGGTVLLTGEAGIGKSRLVREIARAAGARGFIVLTGRAVAGGVPTPFRPFAEALVSAGRAGRLPVSAELDPFRPALGRLVPEWRQPRAAGDESLVYLGEAVLRLLRVLSPDAGCLLVLEDLHWADQETLALLEYLADNLSAERVLCTGTLRDEEGGEAAVLAAALEARGSAAVLPLARLDPAAMARMAVACIGAAELPDTIQSFVAEQAEGVPFLVEEVLAGLIGEGALTERDGSWHAADLVTAAVPATFADAVRRRLDAVDADSRHVLGAAAVLGRRFDWALLGPVTGMTDAAVVAALRRGVGLQLVAADRESFRFRHALTHEAVLAALLPPERALLAGRALAAVEAAHPGVPGAWCMLAADLAGRAGDTARAGALLLEAGRRDLAVGALASAEHTLARAQGADRSRRRRPAHPDRRGADRGLRHVRAGRPGDRAGPDAARPAGPRGPVRPDGEPAPGDRAGGDRRCPVGRGRREHRGRPRGTGSRRRTGRRLRGTGRDRPGAPGRGGPARPGRAARGRERRPARGHVRSPGGDRPGGAAARPGGGGAGVRPRGGRRQRARAAALAPAGAA
jgi:hypothetical protein